MMQDAEESDQQQLDNSEENREKQPGGDWDGSKQNDELSPSVKNLHGASSGPTRKAHQNQDDQETP